MAQVITIAGERLFALKAQNNEQLDIDTFVFAMVPGQDPNAAIDRNEGLPPIGQRVHTVPVQQFGRVNENVVIYSVVLDSLTGPFEFNWVGLYSAANATLIAISHISTVQKTVTVPGTAGNTLNRNFGIEYSGIADLTGITIEPETWQLDYTARLNGMDELTRQLAKDMNGSDWFIENGFKVVPRETVNTFKVTAGAGYVSGLRVELVSDHILTLSVYPQFVYVDAWFDGTSESAWKGQTAFTVTSAEMDDYIDVNGKKHFVFKLASITDAETVEDLRNIVGVGEKIQQLQTAEKLKEKTEQTDLSTLLGTGKKIVIGSDSISFSPFDWPVPVYQVDYAWNNSPGLMSCMHMIRDLAHRADVNFSHADQVAVSKSGSAALKINPSTETDKYFMPFNNRYVSITAYSSADVVRFVVPQRKKSNQLRVHCINTHVPEKAGKADVRLSVYPYSEWIDKGTITTGGRNKFLGLEPYYHDMGDNFEGNYPILVEFYNFRKNDDSAPGVSGIGLTIQAFGEKFTDVKLTGRGGYSSAQVLAEFDTMVTDHSPDLFISTIGANDRRLGVTSDQVINNIRQMVELTRAENAACEIIFVSTTRASNIGFGPEDFVNNEKMKDWLDKIRIEIINLGCRYFDLYTLFDNIDQEVWRFDNIHLTKVGNEIFFNSFASKYFPEALRNSNPALYKTDFQLANYETDPTQEMRRPSGNMVIQFNSATGEYEQISGNDSNAVIKSVEKTAEYILRISTNYQIEHNIDYGRGQNSRNINIAISHFGASEKSIFTRVNTITENYIEFFIINSGVVPPTVITDALNDGEKYMVTWC